MNARPVPQYVLTALLAAVIDLDSFARIYLFDVRKQSNSSSKGSQNSTVSTNLAATASQEPQTLQNLPSSSF